MKKVAITLFLLIITANVFAQQPKWFAGANILNRSVDLDIEYTGNFSRSFHAAGSTLALKGGVVGEYMRASLEYALQQSLKSSDLSKYDYNSTTLGFNVFNRIDLILPFIGIQAEKVNLDFEEGGNSISGVLLGYQLGVSILLPSFLIDFEHASNVNTLSKGSVTLTNEKQYRVGISFIF